jgi:small multidrug resistance family-3 protein
MTNPTPYLPAAKKAGMPSIIGEDPRINADESLIEGRSQILGDGLELIDRCACLRGLCIDDMVQAVIQVVVDEGLLGLAHRTLGGVQLLRHIQARASGFNHLRDTAQLTESNYARMGVLDENARMYILKTFALFVLTAIAEITGCFLPYLWLRKNGSPWLLLPAALSLAIFAWLLTLHPAAAGRVYAAYGGVYVAVALVWLWRVDRVALTHWDLAGAAVTIVGMGIIVWGGWRT